MADWDISIYISVFLEMHIEIRLGILRFSRDLSKKDFSIDAMSFTSADMGPAQRALFQKLVAHFYLVSTRIWTFQRGLICQEVCVR